MTGRTAKPLPARRLHKRVGAAFDGNETESPHHWLFPTDEWTGMSESALSMLMEATSEGELSWVLIPSEGYRL